MIRYGRDFGMGYPNGGGGGRYDRFRNGFRAGPGWAGGPAMEDRGSYPDGPPRGRRDFGPRGGGRDARRGGRPGSRDMGMGMSRDWATGEPWGGESAADRVRAADVMTPNPEAVTPDTSLNEVAAKMRELDVGIIPVVDDLDEFRLQGVITDRDIAVRAAAEGKDMKKSKVSDFMTSEVQTVRENDHVRDIFTVMKRARVRRVPVTDEAGKLVGIVAQADLAVTYAGLDLQRETEVEEVLERISEPARPRWGGRDRGPAPRRYVVGGPVYDDRYRREEDFGDRLRDGWNWVRREARHLMGREYDRGWRR